MEKFYPLKGVFKLRISGNINSKTYEKLSQDLKKFSIVTPSALAVIVNSPGGSAVYSDMIYKSIRSFANQHKIPVYTFAEDIAASGGYYIMCAGDSLFATSSLSMLGNIGTITLLPDISHLASKLGIERRIWSTASIDHSLIGDPLSPYSEEKAKKMKSLLQEIYNGFTAVVSQSRKGKISEDQKDDKLFNGDIFYANEAAKLGLIDGQETFDGAIDRLFPRQRVFDLSRRSRFESYLKLFSN